MLCPASVIDLTQMDWLCNLFVLNMLPLPQDFFGVVGEAKEKSVCVWGGESPVLLGWMNRPLTQPSQRGLPPMQWASLMQAENSAKESVQWKQVPAIHQNKYWERWHLLLYLWLSKHLGGLLSFFKAIFFEPKKNKTPTLPKSPSFEISLPQSLHSLYRSPMGSLKVCDQLEPVASRSQWFMLWVLICLNEKMFIHSPQLSRRMELLLHLKREKGVTCLVRNFFLKRYSA